VADEALGATPAQLNRRVTTLRAALARYERGGSTAALDEAFAAAAAAVATLRGERASEPPEVSEVRRLFAQLPEFERLVALAVAEADRSARVAGVRLWQSFGLRSASPRWSRDELGRAALLVACACAPLAGHGRGWLRDRLLKLAADRWAEQLAGELRGADEAVWRSTLGDRYESVHRRCAPRTSWRTLGLSDLLRSDQQVLDALRARLARWLAEGGELERLPAELEAAFVHRRAPVRMA
jgi:hypothetical protein